LKLPKITDQMLGAWNMILDRLPRARLVIHARAAGEASVRSRLEGSLDPSRFTLIGQQSFARHLQTISSVDIGLDAYPFNGHTTTSHALWMGVPIITRSGSVPTSRVGASLMASVDLPELSTSSFEDYVGRAVELAQDLDGLVAIRASLRERMQRSALMDGARTTLGLQDAFRRAWRAWCAS
jgi:protein O-GlcNAc transferase